MFQTGVDEEESVPFWRQTCGWEAAPGPSNGPGRRLRLAAASSHGPLLLI